MSLTLKQVVEQNGCILHMTKGCSMQPMLVQGRDTVVVEKITKPLKKRDVILFSGKGNNCVLHRIIRVKSGVYITRGDNNLFYDDVVKNEEVIGVLTGYYKGEKFIDCKKNFAYKIYSFLITKYYYIRVLKRKIGSIIKK